MKHLIQLLFYICLSVSWVITAPSDDSDGCIACHQIIDEDRDDDEKIMTHIMEDVHFQKGLSCSDCHGGNPNAGDDEDEAMWDADDFVGAVDKKDQPRFCGKCHSDPEYMRQYSAHLKTDQESQYWSSHHGQKLSENDEHVAVCTDCHGVHGIYPIKDPRSLVYHMNVPTTCKRCHSDKDIMANSGLPTDQFDKYKSSVHGTALFDKKDIGAPACNDCHGNHGAMPPTILSISDICGTCHANNAELFKGSHLREIFIKENIKLCEGCHNYHDIQKPTDESLDWSENETCSHCHPNDQDKAKNLSNALFNIIDSLNIKIEEANETVDLAENKGMEVSELFFSLEDAHKNLIQTRTSIHSFNEEFVRKTSEDGYKAADAAIIGAEQALTEFGFRKKGLIVFSLILTFFVIVLYLKIKSMENK